MKTEKTLPNSKGDEKKTTLFQMLKKWLTWQKAAVIIAAIGLLITIYINFILPIFRKDDAITVMKNDIRTNIKEIEETFNPDETLKLDSTLSNFQRKSLAMTSLWKAINADKSYAKQLNKGLRYVITSIETESSRTTEYNNNTRAMLISCGLMSTKLPPNSTATVFNREKMTDISDALDLKNKLYDYYLGKCIKYLDIAAAKPAGSIQQNKYLKLAVKELDQLRSDPQCYLIDQMLFQWIIEINSLYQTSINN